MSKENIGLHIMTGKKDKQNWSLQSTADFMVFNIIILNYSSYHPCPTTKTLNIFYCRKTILRDFKD